MAWRDLLAADANPSESYGRNRLGGLGGVAAELTIMPISVMKA